jgi:hypothetical protein
MALPGSILPFKDAGAGTVVTQTGEPGRKSSGLPDLDQPCLL